MNRKSILLLGRILLTASSITSGAAFAYDYTPESYVEKVMTDMRDVAEAKLNSYKTPTFTVTKETKGFFTQILSFFKISGNTENLTLTDLAQQKKEMSPEQAVSLLDQALRDEITTFAPELKILVLLDSIDEKVKIAAIKRLGQIVDEQTGINFVEKELTQEVLDTAPLLVKQAAHQQYSDEYFLKDISKIHPLVVTSRISVGHVCKLIEKYEQLQTFDFICSIAEHGSITPGVARILANLLSCWDTIKILDHNYYSKKMLEHGNEEVLVGAHLLQVVKNFNGSSVISRLLKIAAVKSIAGKENISSLEPYEIKPIVENFSINRVLLLRLIGKALTGRIHPLSLFKWKQIKKFIETEFIIPITFQVGRAEKIEITDTHIIEYKPKPF